MKKQLIESWNAMHQSGNSELVIAWAASQFRNKVVFASSFGAEDQVILHMLAHIAPGIPVVTLDTGRLFPETYDLIEVCRNRYKHQIKILFPDHKAVESMVNEKGPNLFYESIENRKLCCSIRKTEPLKRALHGKKAWICGIRKIQSVTRHQSNLIEWDAQFGLVKISPLIDWSDEQVWEFIRVNKIPYNPLHDKGYPSIGCLPCTRAVMPGEDPRAGRWWWENPETRECGLHSEQPK